MALPLEIIFSVILLNENFIHIKVLYYIGCGAPQPFTHPATKRETCSSIVYGVTSIFLFEYTCGNCFFSRVMALNHHGSQESDQFGKTRFIQINV